jgi:EPS-associated MarR family transcriptional regulator
MVNSCLETDFKILDTLSRRPDLNQRELERELGVSLGKTHYLLAALIDRGMVRAQNFKNSRRKLAYAYIQMPYGIKEKTRITQRFIQSKLREYEHLKRGIEELQKHFDISANLDRRI